MKILLVEDDAALRAALEELLHREGYEVQKAANFREARGGLDAGGNDYVTKPFRMQELLSRIRALLRGRNTVDSVISRSGITLDKSRLQASRDGETLILTLTEYKILSKLLSSRSILTRSALLESRWDTDSRFIDDNTLSVHVSRLREKVGAAHIKTVRGVGYQWVE